MFRRSNRLQEAGYYTDEGTPSVSYKDILYRVFRRRRRPRRHVDQNINFMTDDDFPQPSTSRNTDIGTTETQTQTSQTLTLTRTTQTSTPTMTTQTHDTQTLTLTRTTQTQDNCNFWTKFVGGLLFLLLLAFAVHTHLQLRKARQEVQSLRKDLDVYAPQADTLTNFALESQGARVLHSLSSDTFWPQDNIGIWDRISYWWYSFTTQRRVIQGQLPLQPGQCWPFSGDKGHLLIFLSHPVSITSVTLGHITKRQSPYGHIASAPREFSIYGLRTTDDEGVHLGTFVYDKDGAAHQIFGVPNPDTGVFRYVQLRINSNWGNIDNTCLYSFRVHGKLPVRSLVNKWWRQPLLLEKMAAGDGQRETWEQLNNK